MVDTAFSTKTEQATVKLLDSSKLNEEQVAYISDQILKAIEKEPNNLVPLNEEKIVELFKKGNFIIAIHEGNFAGCLLKEQVGDLIWISTVYVPKELRGQRIAPQLLSEVINRHPDMLLAFDTINENMVRSGLSAGFQIAEGVLTRSQWIQITKHDFRRHPIGYIKGLTKSNGSQYSIMYYRPQGGQSSQ